MQNQLDYDELEMYQIYITSTHRYLACQKLRNPIQFWSVNTAQPGINALISISILFNVETVAVATRLKCKVNPTDLGLKLYFSNVVSEPPS